MHESHSMADASPLWMSMALLAMADGRSLQTVQRRRLSTKIMHGLTTCCLISWD
jgi:hypothetical protein